MIRQTVRSAALLAAGALLAGGTSWVHGQATLTQTASGPTKIAAEYFGVARKIKVSDFDLDGDRTDGSTERPYVGLQVGGADIEAGNVAELTYRLSNATFADNVSPIHLDEREGNSDCNAVATAGDDLEVTVKDGTGKAGDSTVTFRLEVGDSAVGTGELAENDSICFWVPDVMATGTVEVAVTVNIVSTTGTRFPSKVTPATDPANADTVFEAAPAIAVSLNMGGTSYVAVPGDRLTVARGEAEPGGKAKGVLVGNLTIAATADADEIWQLNGADYVYDPTSGFDSDLGGQIDLELRSNRAFDAGGRLVLGTAVPRSSQPSGGVAEASVQLVETAGIKLVYVPGGVDILKPTDFTATARYDFNDPDNDSSMAILPSMGHLRYDNVTVQGYAYGVVRGATSPDDDPLDTSFVRITCEATKDCTVFPDCNDLDGDNYFSSEPLTIAPRHTQVVNSDAMAALLGGGWETGRGSCDFWSTGELALQHMVRAGGVLVNSTPVVGRGLDEEADEASVHALAEAKKICASVGENDADDDTTGDQPTACLPKPAP